MSETLERATSSEVIAVEKLKNFVERVERLEEQKNAISEDMKEVYREAKYHGFDVMIMKKVIKMRAMDSAKLQEQEQLLELYKEALGLTS
jgi:uncharacterized protein (UPF0335 family)